MEKVDVRDIKLRSAAKEGYEVLNWTVKSLYLEYTMFLSRDNWQPCSDRTTI